MKARAGEFSSGSEFFFANFAPFHRFPLETCAFSGQGSALGFYKSASFSPWVKEGEMKIPENMKSMGSG